MLFAKPKWLLAMEQTVDAICEAAEYLNTLTSEGIKPPMWNPTEYISIGDAKSGTMVSGWMVRREGASGNTRERADSIFVPMKWTPEPPKAVVDLAALLNAGEATEERKAA